MTRGLATSRLPILSSGMHRKINSDLDCSSSSLPADATVAGSSREEHHPFQDGSLHLETRHRKSAGSSPARPRDVSRHFSFSHFDISASIDGAASQAGRLCDFKSREPGRPFSFSLLDKSPFDDRPVSFVASRAFETDMVQSHDTAKLSPPSGPSSLERMGSVDPSSLVRAFRSGIAGVTCDVCGRWASCKAELDRHLRIHTGEKPFKCHLCPYSASVKCNLRTHLKTKHLDEIK